MKRGMSRPALRVGPSLRQAPEPVRVSQVDGPSGGGGGIRLEDGSGFLRAEDNTYLLQEG